MMLAHRRSQRSSAPTIKLITLLLAGMGGWGCSLTNLTDVIAHECAGDNEEGDKGCRDALNEEHGFYPSCPAFKCVKFEDTFRCEEQSEEVCDGLDNDCDYLIDEAVAGEPILSPDEPETLTSGVEIVTQISVVSSPAINELYLQSMGGVAHAPLNPGDLTSTSLWTNQSDDDGNNTDLVEGCRLSANAESNQTYVNKSCNSTQTVVAAGEEQGFFTSVSTDGCRSGNLRVGAIDPSQLEKLIDRGPLFRDPSWRGVAAHPSTQCTNNGSTACEEAIEAFDSSNDSQKDEKREGVLDVCGASQLAIAALTTQKSEGQTLYDQALMVFLGAPADANTCDKETEIRGMALQERNGPPGNTFYWVDPSNDGIPELIGATRGGTPPSVLPFENRGFLIAYGDTDKSVRLTWIPKQGRSGSADGIDPCTNACPDREGRETKPLIGLEELTRLPNEKSDAAAKDVVMKWLEVDEGTGTLAVSWREGCADVAPVFAQILRLDVSANGLPSLKRKGPRISVGKSNDAPVVVPAKKGFVVPGFSRSDEVASSKETGGFFVVTRPSQVEAIRIASFDGRILDSTERLELGTSSLTILDSLPHERPQLLMHALKESELQVTSLYCGD